jgi:hypothetical protein
MKHLIAIFLLIITFSVVGQRNYWQQTVDYTMDIDFDVEKDQYQGHQVLVYTNNSPDTLYHVYYHLYFNAFQPNSMMDVRSRNIEDPSWKIRDRISKLSPEEIGYLKVQSLIQDGKPLNYNVEGTVLEVTLALPIMPGSSTTITMDFEGQVPLQVRRSGRDNKEGIEYSMSQWYPKMAEYDERGWHAHPYVAREFYAPWGDFEVNIKIDKSYILGGTGIVQNKEEVGYGYQSDPSAEPKRRGKKLTWKFKAENVHDFMWAADPDYKHTTYQVPNGPTLHFLYQDDSATIHWESLPKFAGKIFEIINENFGVYPYPEFSVVQGGDGGMEYPMSTLITGNRSLPSLVGVTIHEVLHSWYQGVLATNESYYAWMDEGFTSYAEERVTEELFKMDISNAKSGSYRGYYSLASSGKEEPMSTHSDQYETNFAYARAAYSKGAVSLAQLGYIIGETARDEGLIRYFNEWKFKHPDMNDFIRVMEKTSGIELDWYYDYWVNSTKTIDYGIDSVISQSSKTAVTLSRIGYMPMPIDLVVTKKDGSQVTYYIPLGIMRGEKPNESGMERVLLQDWYWTHPTYELKLDLPMNNIASIEIDPSQRMADVDRENNSWNAN